MKTTTNDRLIAYITLFSGLAISAVAEYYSIMGLMAIYPAALFPIVIMGIVLGAGKLSATVWMKQNWEWSPRFLKLYVIPAIIVLMLITSLGVFGFLSKAHSDQSLVSGDVQSKLAIYDEKIKTAKENIDADRKQLKQMDEAVDQIMGRSTDEKGADKANSVRKSQQRDRASLAKDIETQQRLIASLNDEAAPIRAENRKVEAEVGPIKYIAALIYGANPDSSLLEKAVIWVTVLIVIVLDPLALVLLLASQYSFQHIRDDEESTTIAELDTFVGEKPTPEELHFEEDADLEPAPLEEAKIPEPKIDFEGVRTPGGEWIQTGPSFEVPNTSIENETPEEIEEWNRLLAAAEKAVTPPVEYKILEEDSGEEDFPEPKAPPVITHTEEGVVVEDSAGKQVIPAQVVSEEYVQVGDHRYHHKAFDPSSRNAKDAVDRHNSSYVQNEEQIEADTKWKEITNAEYQETARKNQQGN